MTSYYDPKDLQSFAEIGKDAQGEFPAGQQKLAGFSRVVGHCYGPDIQAADAETVLGVETPQLVAAVTAAGPGRAVAEIDGNAETARQRRHSSAVIGVFMGYQDRVQLLRPHPEALHPPLGFARGKPAVHHQQGVAGPDQGCVALAAGPERGKPH